MFSVNDLTNNFLRLRITLFLNIEEHFIMPCYA